MAAQPSSDVFELSILGGAPERRYRRLRPDIEALPWDTLDTSHYPEALLSQARRFWTEAAFQEHRTGAACAHALELLITARAPVDLIAMASRFVLDEMAHVELCARVATALGGGASITYDPNSLFDRPADHLPPLRRAAELILAVFCVGEAFSVGMQRITAKAEPHPLLRGVISRIARDESAHGAFGWTFFDWADGETDRRDALTEQDRVALRDIARRATTHLEQTFLAPSPAPKAPLIPPLTLGWLPGPLYRKEAISVMERLVYRPLRDRDLIAPELLTDRHLRP